MYASDVQSRDNDNDTEWKPILAAYYTFFVIDLFLWTLPLCIIMQIASDDDDSTLMTAHIAITDVLTDIPMTITTLVGRTYIGNVYFLFDIIVKFVLFARAVVWLPIESFSDEIEFEGFSLDYKLSSCDNDDDDDSHARPERAASASA